MTDNIESIYNRLIADEKLKSGTKYERLAAIAFKIVTEDETGHDFRLRGDSGVPHQIDAVVGKDRRRVLIEAKDYEKTVDLPVVRNFWGVVEDVGPDEAFVLTTRGFSDNAVRYVSAKGTKLAVLRPLLDDSDRAGVLKQVDLRLRTSVPSDPETQWHPHPSVVAEGSALSDAPGRVLTNDVEIEEASGRRLAFGPMLRRQIEDKYSALEPGKEALFNRR